MTVRKRNPVHFMASIEALDLLVEALRLLRLKLPAPPEFLDRLREAILLHQRQLRNVIGTEPV